MESRHQADPEHLRHFSEDPAIERFVPHVPATNPDQPPMVWTVDDVHAPLFWFPRDCPRITFWADDGCPPDASARPRRRGCTRSRRAGSSACSACELWVYRFAVDGFEPWPGADGYWVSDRRAHGRSTSRPSATCSSATASAASSCGCSPTCASCGTR